MIKHSALARGVLITIEGIDGSGKSTLTKNLTSALTLRGFPTIATREPGDSVLGNAVRTLLIDKAIPKERSAEALLFAADRAQHIHEVIRPNLSQKKLILSDRFADSSIAYQCYGNGLPLEVITTINSWLLDGLQPDCILYPVISPEAALERIQSRGLATTRWEKKEFIEKVYTGFETLFQNRPNVIRLDAQVSPEELTQQATEKVLLWLHAHHLILT